MLWYHFLKIKNEPLDSEFQRTFMSRKMAWNYFSLFPLVGIAKNPGHYM